jgi:pimeloyl-ACP methyl ester carboxylesterase
MLPETIKVEAMGVALTGFAIASGARERPLLLLLHGGGVDAHYFDPVIELGAANGFPAIALNRPGYGDSEPRSFAQQAEVLDAAVDELWRDQAEGRPGAVVFGHSIGAAVAVHVAARQPEWPLLGISLTGISASVPPFLVQAWESLPSGERVAFTPRASGTIRLFGASSELEAGTPSAELVEVATGWAADCPVVSAQVTVPVQFAVGERDKLWLVDETTAEDVAALFTKAPYVDSQLLPGVGHAVEHAGELGRSHVLRQLSFALRCTGPPRAVRF